MSELLSRTVSVSDASQVPSVPETVGEGETVFGKTCVLYNSFPVIPTSRHFWSPLHIVCVDITRHVLPTE